MGRGGGGERGEGGRRVRGEKCEEWSEGGRSGVRGER